MYSQKDLGLVSAKAGSTRSMLNMVEELEETNSGNGDLSALNRGSMQAMDHLRSYLQALVNLCLDNKLDKEKFVYFLQGAQAQYLEHEAKTAK